MILTACSAGDSNDAERSSTWRKADIDGEIRALGSGFYSGEQPAIVAAGERDGEPVFASVAEGEVRFLRSVPCRPRRSTWPQQRRTGTGRLERRRRRIGPVRPDLDRGRLRDLRNGRAP
jgi:hypothetical protein